MIFKKIYPDFPDAFGPPLKDEEASQHQATLDVGLTRTGFCCPRCGFPCGADVVADNNICAGIALESLGSCSLLLLKRTGLLARDAQVSSRNLFEEIPQTPKTRKGSGGNLRPSERKGS